MRGRALTDWVSAATSPATLARPQIAPAPPPPDFWPAGEWNDRAFSPDGRTFAIAAKSDVFGLYDNLEQRRLAMLHGHGKSVLVMTFSAEGTRLVSVSSGDQPVTLWDVVTGRELLTLRVKESNFETAEFSDDGGTLLIGRETGRGWLCWRVPSWPEIEAAERVGGRWPRRPEN